MGNQLPLDYTRCSGKRCDRKKECMRWTGRPGLLEHIGDRQVSLAQFADADGVCEKFIDERSNDLEERSTG